MEFNPNMTGPTPVAGDSSHRLATTKFVTDALQSLSGTWTPTLAGQTTAGTQTYSVQEGFWHRINDLCFVNYRLTMTAKDGATAGNLLLTGLPFDSMSAGHANQALPLSEWSAITLTAGYTHVTLRINLGDTHVLFVQNGSGVNADVINSATGLANNTEVCGSGVYRINLP